MARPRTFDEQETIRVAVQVFTRTGYDGTSIDDLVQATGLLRGSLYKAFGSKRGLFLSCLRSASAQDLRDDDVTDLLLVATLELAPRDSEVRSLVAQAIEKYPSDEEAAATLGRRLLQRANIGR
jgi:TetR/AcrR family transcriptional regulator, transcriptional repressor for nem operon